MRVPTGRLRIVSTQPTEGAEVHEGPPSPGRYIREARQRRGISVEQLALETKIPRPSLEALEEDQFSALPGPVFVRGFFRCCARSLSLDPDTVAGLLHDHLHAQKAAAQRRRVVPMRRRKPAIGRSRPSAGRASRLAPRVRSRSRPPSPSTVQRRWRLPRRRLRSLSPTRRWRRSIASAPSRSTCCARSTGSRRAAL
ncbi:helix-turn-helix domain-containing protein [Nannocystis pusilla]|uniref:helix-turn-helix domain-containing protein n=1 Tax=Nannocystis pusilla TaxID=889268 RepID=UPI003B78130C